MSRPINPSEFHIDETNSETGPVVRWNSNNNIPPRDCLDEIKRAGNIDHQTWENSIEQYQIETDAFLQEYVERERNRELAPEELAEMRSVFGAGTIVLNALTGKYIKL
jgi:hypothetical protein